MGIIFLVCGSRLCPTHVVVWLDGWGKALFVMNRLSLSQSSNNFLPFSVLLPFEYFPMLLSPSVNCPTLALKIYLYIYIFILVVILLLHTHVHIFIYCNDILFWLSLLLSLSFPGWKLNKFIK